MKDNNLEIVDNNVQTDNQQSASVVMPETKKDTSMEPQVLDVPVDKKELKRLEKQRRKEEKQKLKEEVRRLKEEKKGKGKKVAEEVKPEEKVVEQPKTDEPVTIVETAITKGASGSQVIGNINGDIIEPTNIPLPEPIDITVKQKVNTKSKNKKVKVISKREKVVSIIVSIVVVLIIAGVGFGVYYFGYKTNPSIYNLKNIYLELGEQLPTTVANYIDNPNQYDDMEYVLDLSNVAQNIVGTYNYTVKHKNVVKSAQIIVRDTTAPVLTIKDSSTLVFQLNSKVNKDNIVESCEDLSNCTYKTEFDINTEEPGEKEINIIAKDDVGNETIEKVTIKIIDIKKTLICTSKDVDSSDKKFKYNNVYTLNFDGNDYLVQKSGVTLYTYNDYSAFFAKYNEYFGRDEYVFDRMTFTYTEKIEVNTGNYTKFNDLVNYYNENGFTCK